MSGGTATARLAPHLVVRDENVVVLLRGAPQNVRAREADHLVSELLSERCHEEREEGELEEQKHFQAQQLQGERHVLVNPALGRRIVRRARRHHPVR